MMTHLTIVKKVPARCGVVIALILGMLISVRLPAQVVGATLSGTVTDQTGAAIPNAQVSIGNVSTGVKRKIAADTSGFYVAPNLIPGNYEITASAAGFATQVRTGVPLEVGAQQRLDITLQVGEVAQTVEVTSQTPQVELESSSISAEVSSTTIRELPLNGRSWTDLAKLQPGVAAIETQHALGVGPERGNRGFGDQITVDGARPQQNNYRLDGISINDHQNGAGSVIGGNLGVDAIQEFSVLTSNYSAEYGRTSGGVVNAITRSGTNQFHGGAYEFLRNSALDARNFFDGATIPPFRRNEFGADAGAPILKDKLFAFVDYEGIRQSLGITNVDTVPSVAARNGTICSAPDTTPACVPTPIPGGVDPSVQKYLPLWPLPNGGIQPGTNGDIAIADVTVQQVVSENFITTRIDYKLAGNDSLVATYLGDIATFGGPTALGDLLNQSRTDRQIATLEETHSFTPLLVNSARIGYNRAAVANNIAVSAINPLAGDPTLGAIPGFDSAEVDVGGLTNSDAGLKGANNIIDTWNSFQAYDDAFWTHGKHSVKFGGAVERMQLNFHFYTNEAGQFTFGSLANFLMNEPQRLSVHFASTSSPRDLRQTLGGLYIQDDWHARSNLTVNMGIRWEMTTVPTEVDGKLSNLINITDSTPHLGSPFFSNPTLRNFEPRIGFAWDPFHNGKTAVRGGIGLFDVLPLLYQFTGNTDAAFPYSTSAQGSNLPPGSFYTAAASLLSPASNEATYVEQHPHRSYVLQWNLNVQHEITPSLSAMVGYVGSRGVHLPVQVQDTNMVIPVLTPAGYLFPSPVGTGTKINPNFGPIAGTFYAAGSSYQALLVGVVKRMSHGFQLQTSFTWGKSIDDSSSAGVGDEFSNSMSSLPWYNLNSIRGLSDFNVGRSLVINGTWDVPSPKSFSGPAAWVTNGWELGLIYKVSDGTPFTATFGTDGDPQGLNSGDPWAFPDRLTGSGCSSLVNPGNPNNYIKTQCFAIPTAPSSAFYTANCDPAFGAAPQCFNLRGNAGRNILTGPGLSNLDFSVFKNNYIKRISENFNVQFRAEVFNILNRANFAVPSTPTNTDIFLSTGPPTGVAGLLTSTSTTSRQIQFALKTSW
jgi:hypothetical protein